MNKAQNQSPLSSLFVFWHVFFFHLHFWKISVSGQEGNRSFLDLLLEEFSRCGRVVRDLNKVVFLARRLVVSVSE